ncbi:MAG TPA: selenium metabolism-associated LysR family transcriptional regulator [Syntrophorhabdales bacterium]|nr:selenium metabolism-associated LysR family transcriptional regulator [Syntrophorhabdales bacterium]
MNIHHLESFVRIIELKSFTKAAEELGLTQPTVSKQIVDLEEFFQVRLIDRTKRSLALTRAGEILFKYAKDFISLKRDTVDAMASFRGLKSGSLRLGASSIPGVYILPPILKAFKGRYSGVDLSLVLSDSQDIAGRVENGDVDIGFVGSREETKRIAYKQFLEDSIIFIAPLEFPEAIDVRDIARYPLLVREPGSGTRKCFETALMKRHLKPGDLHVVGELGDTEAIKAAVREGMGISYISNRAVREELDRGLLKVLSVKGFPGVKRSFYIITKKGRSTSPQTEALLKIIKEWRHHEQE